MTELTYLNDFDVEDCDSLLVASTPAEGGEHELILAATCFYPRGGGQDWDTGLITSGEKTFRVREVRLSADGAVHPLGSVTNGRFDVGDTVHCQVDSARRRLHTRLHSAAHVIDMAVSALDLDWVSTKGQHYPDLSAVEYSGSWNAEQGDAIRSRIEIVTNGLIEAGSSNRIVFMPVAEMKSVCRNVPENIPNNKPARVVMYGESFGIPCGGTHVRDIKDVGPVSIPKLKNKKGIIRLSYVLGDMSEAQGSQ